MGTIIVIILIRFAVLYSGLLKLIKIKTKNFKIKSKNSEQFFDQHFIEPKNFYIKIFNTVPCVAYIGNVDIKKIFELINDNNYGKVKDVYQRIYHDWDNDKIRFSKTIFILENKMMVKLVKIGLKFISSTKDYDLANEMLNEFKTYKAPEKEKDYEINIISLSDNQLDLKTLAIKPTTLDIDLYYNDDFKAIDAINKRKIG